MVPVDLTHPITEEVRIWDGSCGFQSEILHDYDESGFRVCTYHVNGGCGTHIDAPAHIDPDGGDIASIPLERLIVPAVVLDIRHKTADDPSYFATLDDLQEHEEAYGAIPEGSLLLVLTGWDQYWGKDGYRPTFPGVSLELAEALFDRLVGIGIDTLSPDGTNHDFPVHKLYLPSGRYLVENLTGLDKLPPRGAYAAILPLKVAGGTEAPVRAVALIFDQSI